MKAFRSFFGDHRGAAAVEFALVVVPLLLFLFGTIEFARLMWTRQSMQSLAITAARCMGILGTACSTNGTTVDMTLTKSYVISRASGFGVRLTSGDITVTSNASVDECRVSGFSKVTINYTFNTVAPKLIAVLAGGSQLQVEACFPNAA
jgi:Flp pilus assembly protein TadG